jgi:glucan biosynthesis protein
MQHQNVRGFAVLSLHRIDVSAFFADRLLRAGLVCLFVAALSAVPAGAALAFDFSDVMKRAEQLAGAPYQKPSSNLPKEL